MYIPRIIKIAPVIIFRISSGKKEWMFAPIIIAMLSTSICPSKAPVNTCHGAL